MKEFTPDIEVIPGTDALLQMVTSVLDARGYAYHTLDEHAIALTLRTPHGLYSLFFWANADADVVQLTGSYGSAAPADRRAAVAEAAAPTWKTAG